MYNYKQKCVVDSVVRNLHMQSDSKTFEEIKYVGSSRIRDTTAILIIIITG